MYKEKEMTTRFLSIHKYRQDIEVNKVKGLILPKLRGTWLPSIDKQMVSHAYKHGFCGIAFNWLSIRIRVSF